MQIKYELTKKDYLKFNLFHMTYSKTLRITNFIVRYLVPVYFIISEGITKPMSEQNLMGLIIVSILFSVIWVFIVYPLFTKFFNMMSLSKMVDEGKNKGLFGDHTITLTEDCIVNQNKFVESKTQYCTVEHVVEAKEYIYIYVSAVQAYIIPLRSFDSMEHRTEFSDKLNALIEKSKLENKIEA